MVMLIYANLGFGGYTAGAARYYGVYYLGYSSSYDFFLRDTVLSVYSWDGSGSRCSFSSLVDRADFIIYEILYDTTTPVYDTGFAYYDGTYLVDFGNIFIHPPFLEAPVRVLKFPLIVGESWQAVDTCKAALRQTFPSPAGDGDYDGIVDSIYYDTSYATLTYHSGDTVEVLLSPLIVALRMTSVSPYDDTTLACCENDIFKMYIRLRYVNGIGLTYLNIDSLMVYVSYALIDTAETPWDTTYMPPTLYQTYYNYEVWEYITTGVSERETHSVAFVLKDKEIEAKEDISIYRYDGRIVKRLKAGQKVRLRKGIYFVKTRRGTEKIIF